ncbi:YraN family protein [Paenibacillus sp. YYML68]|uniref:YraN family protein n=1 Tax=Paenibacillus sp. YYML68 TaxID=2909250 RepID=UPI002492ADCF|nr:YraN family protein [Paenibacillus sp. YYML68]
MNEHLAGRKQRGARGEAAALQHIQKQGFRVLAHNWRCRSGELDIVAEDDGALVIIEVRTRNMSERFGTPFESVNARKQLQLIRTAQVFVHEQRKHAMQMRFDVISVRINAEGVVQQLDHIRSAF